MVERTEFGARRTSCSCDGCRQNCRHMPGFLIPADLDRMIPAEIQGDTKAVKAWAEENLLASPGAIVLDSSTGNMGRIKTLVPATKPDGSCIHLTAEERCAVHEIAPFGCAFFSCKPEPKGLSRLGLLRVRDAMRFELYGVIWRYLNAVGKVQHGPEVLRERMSREGTA